MDHLQVGRIPISRHSSMLNFNSNNSPLSSSCLSVGVGRWICLRRNLTSWIGDLNPSTTLKLFSSLTKPKEPHKEQDYLRLNLLSSILMSPSSKRLISIVSNRNLSANICSPTRSPNNTLSSDILKKLPNHPHFNSWLIKWYRFRMRVRIRVGRVGLGVRWVVSSQEYSVVEQREVAGRILELGNRMLPSYVKQMRLIWRNLITQQVSM
jgi:hypothetical protein